jgi:hypothetical protein
MPFLETEKGVTVQHPRLLTHIVLLHCMESERAAH